MRALTTLAGTLLMLSTTCNAFMMLLEMPMTRTTHPLRKSEELSASTKLGSEIEEGDSPSLGLLSRRSLLATTTGLAVAGSVWKAQTSSSSQTTTKTNFVGLSSTTTITTTSSSTFDLDQVMHIMESSVDKRFLHAVVASDYQSLYMKLPEGISSSITQQQRRRRGRLSPSVLVVTQSALLAAATTTTSSSYFLRGLPDSVQESLKVQLEGRRRIPRIQVDKSILVHSHWETAARMWGKENIVSVWPLDLSSKGEDANRKTTVHYAWPAQEGDFLAAIPQPQQLLQQETSTKQDEMIIVDGIDCGRMSLEDALQGDRQILVQAEQFLLIPQSMEQALRERLQGAFLI